MPLLDEEEVLPRLIARLDSLLAGLPAGSEAVLVDDGSNDATPGLLREQAARDPRFRVVALSRNFGHAAALTAGLDAARGDAIVFMDGDLQDPPELVPQMVALYREGYDVVHARRVSRERESVFKTVSAWLFYRLMRMATRNGLPADVGEFRLISREVADALRRFQERHRLMRGLVAWLGFRSTIVDYKRPGRAAGTTKFPLVRMIRLSFDAMTSFSAVPLRLATLLGIGAFLCGIGYAIYAMYIGFILRIGVPGWTSLVILNIFFSGVVLICLGLIGEYVARVFEEVKKRPLYIVRNPAAGDDPGDPDA